MGGVFYFLRRGSPRKVEHTKNSIKGSWACPEVLEGEILLPMQSAEQDLQGIFCTLDTVDDRGDVSAMSLFIGEGVVRPIADELFFDLGNVDTFLFGLVDG